MKKWLLAISLLLPALAFGADAPKIDTGNTAWMIMASALVLLMTPAGLALFYGGMTRSKNILNTYAMVFVGFSVAFIVWIIAGYSLAFGTATGDMNNFMGGFANVMLDGIKWSDLTTVGFYPQYVFVFFQGTFAAITVAIASGSVIERMKFSTWVIFAAIWTAAVYGPIAHMVWGGGYLMKLGALDFAGGTVVHMNGGLAGLVLAILIGKRTGYPMIAMKPMSVMLTALGAALLWFGWYGFNAGSAFGASTIAGLAALTTTVATAVAAVTWLVIEWTVFKKPTLLGAASGVVAGLVAITPAAGFVDVSGAMMIGIGGSVVGFFGVATLKKIFKYDDSLDAFGIHFLGGLWGAVATGIFALNDKDLLWDGPLKATGDRLGQIGVQLESAAVVAAYTLIATVVVYFIASALTGGGRVDEETEAVGLDEAVHGERGLNL